MIRSRIFIFSSILVLVGAAFYLNRWEYAPYLFATGAVGVTVCYLTLPYKSPNYRMRRLQRINILAGIAMIVASVFMFKQQTAWVVFLLISAMLQLYTSFATKEHES